MPGIYIPNAEIPESGCFFVGLDNTHGKDEAIITVERMVGNSDRRIVLGSYKLVPTKGDLYEAYICKDGKWVPHVGKEDTDA